MGKTPRGSVGSTRWRRLRCQHCLRDATALSWPSVDRIVIRMLAEGGHPLDAFVAQEQLVIYFNQNTPEDKLVPIYPAEGTFWMDHPLVLLDGPWVTEAQQRTFREFATFVGKPAQQRLVLREGYRPARAPWQDPPSRVLRNTEECRSRSGSERPPRP